jgi:hypothetical protein
MGIRIAVNGAENVDYPLGKKNWIESKRVSRREIRDNEGLFAVQFQSNVNILKLLSNLIAGVRIIRPFLNERTY